MAVLTRTRDLAVASTPFLASGSTSSSSTEASSLPATLFHPRYLEWAEDWRMMGHVYEGDGPFRTGDALVPHARELVYAKHPETGEADFANPIGVQRKFQQRKACAHYENFASVIVDALVDYQFGKRPARTIKPRGVLGHHPLELWWENVDGLGTGIDDWLTIAVTLAHVFGHAFVVMDREERLEAGLSGRNPKIRTREQESRPVLRLYVPLDVPDWLAPAGKLTAVKLHEYTERSSLLTPASAPDSSFLVLDQTSWTRVDGGGRKLGSGLHHFGRLPVLHFAPRRRAGIPIIGRSVLRDPRLFYAHYNMLSELREIFRNQTFSMLNIQMGDTETVETARANLGTHAGTDSLVFSHGRADFIAPPDGPATLYAERIHDLETKIFRLAGMNYEQDSRQGVSEGTARIKAMDLNRALTTFATRTEILDYAIAELWALATYGDQALQILDQDDLTIAHPSEFYTEELAQVVQDAAATIAVGVGPTATVLIKKRVVHVALRDASREDLGQIEQEIEERGVVDAEEAQAILDVANKSGKPGALLEQLASAMGRGTGDGEPDHAPGTDPSSPSSTAGKGTDPNNQSGTRGKSTDPRAGATRGSDAGSSTKPSRAVTTVAELRRKHKPLR